MDIGWMGCISCEAIGPSLTELVGHSQCRPGEVSNAELLHIFDGHFLVLVDIQHFEEGVHVFLLGVVGGVEDPVCVSQDGHGLDGGRGTLTGSMVPLRSLS